MKTQQAIVQHFVYNLFCMDDPQTSMVAHRDGGCIGIMHAIFTLNQLILGGYLSGNLWANPRLITIFKTNNFQD